MRGRKGGRENDKEIRQTGSEEMNEMQGHVKKRDKELEFRLEEGKKKVELLSRRHLVKNMNRKERIHVSAEAEHGGF